MCDCSPCALVDALPYDLFLFFFAFGPVSAPVISFVYCSPCAPVLYYIISFMICYPYVLCLCFRCVLFIIYSVKLTFLICLNQSLEDLLHE